MPRSLARPTKKMQANQPAIGKVFDWIFIKTSLFEASIWICRYNEPLQKIATTVANIGVQREGAATVIRPPPLVGLFVTNFTKRIIFSIFATPPLSLAPLLSFSVRPWLQFCLQLHWVLNKTVNFRVCVLGIEYSPLC